MRSKQARRRVNKAGTKKKFNKYELYLDAVQSPDVDVEFFREVYRELRRKDPRVFREDFCGTFSLCTEWVKLNPKNTAYGLDLDPEPLAYGKRHHLTRLSEQQKLRVHALEKNVMSLAVPTSDIIAAMNFSYFVFKKREDLKKYFSNALRKLKPKGVFIVDIFGGSACFDENEEKTSYRKYTYFWHQHGFDPVSARAKFSIHFKLKGHRKIEDVFTYDWRMWSIPEIREIMQESGFKKTHVYWEGTDRRGEGDGNFSRTEKGEECEAWVAYIAAEK